MILRAPSARAVYLYKNKMTLSDKEKEALKKEAAEKSSIAFLLEQIKNIEKKKSESEALLQDPEMKELAQAELEELEAQEENIYLEIKKVIDKEKEEQEFPNEITLELRAGAGGDEASLFAYELADMYIKYSEKKGWQVAVVDESRNDLGGYKEAIFTIKGEGVYKTLMYETGVHRVQRVPSTEKQGRIHTSTASVAVLPIYKQTTVEIKESDLEIDFFKSGGKGGQNVNKVETAVRITHKPTGEVVKCSAERSQQRNRERAMQMLASRLQQAENERLAKEASSERSAQIGRMDRSEKIRTYNFPQDRITDHRIKKSWSGIEKVMQGNLDEIIETLHEEMNKIQN